MVLYHTRWRQTRSSPPISQNNKEVGAKWNISHRVKLYFHSNKSALLFFCLKLVTNMSGYGYLYQKMKINEGFCPKSHILPTMKNFPEIGLKCNKIYDARWCKAKNLCCPCKEFFNWSRGLSNMRQKPDFQVDDTLWHPCYIKRKVAKNS